MTIEDKLLNYVFGECPILLEDEFKKKYPKMVEVVKYLYESASWSYRADGKYVTFDELGISTITEYVQLVKDGNLDAIRTYERFKDAV